MELITIEEFENKLDDRLKVSHLGNLQIQLSDKLKIYLVKHNDTGYIEYSNGSYATRLRSMFMKLEFYGEEHKVIVDKEEEDGEVYFTEVYSSGNLIESLSSFIENDFQDYIKILWDKVEAGLN